MMHTQQQCEHNHKHGFAKNSFIMHLLLDNITNDYTKDIKYFVKNVLHFLL